MELLFRRQSCRFLSIGVVYVLAGLTLGVPPAAAETITFYPWVVGGGYEIKLKVVGQKDIGDSKDHIPIMELSETVPNQLEPGASYGYWMVWPVNSGIERSLLLRALQYYFFLSAPEGGFELHVECRAIARMSHSKQQGVLTFFSFDPHRKQPLDQFLLFWENIKQPLQLLEKQGLLTEQQKQKLNESQKVLEVHYAGMITKWRRFQQTPRDLDVRKAFFEALSIVQPDNEAYRPDAIKNNFYTSEQRTALRKAGITVRGCAIRESIDNSSNRYRWRFVNYPFSQLEEEWDRGRIINYPGGDLETGKLAQHPRIHVRDDRRNEEIDPRFEIAIDEFDGLEKNRHVILQKLLSIDGVELNSGVKK